jgi:hypothetical protein
MEVLDRNASLFADQMGSTQCDDLQHANLIFREARGGWQLAGVLDWDKAWAGPSGSDIARMSFWDDMTGAWLLGGLSDGGATSGGTLRACAGLSAAVVPRVHGQQPRHLADTVSVCRRLGIEISAPPVRAPVRVLLLAADVSFRTWIISRLREGLRWSPAPVVGWARDRLRLRGSRSNCLCHRADHPVGVGAVTTARHGP